MNNLAYSSQQLDKIGPQVEEKLRKEMGAAGPIPYQVESGGAGSTTVGTVVGDMARGLFGGHSDLLFTLVFDLATPRAAQLRASVARQGIGSHVGTLLYTTRLAKTIAAPVNLEPPKMFGAPKFAGDPAASGKLNAKSDIAKRVVKFSRTESEIGGLTIKTERLVTLAPHENGVLVAISTLPRPTSMGMDASLDAKEFFDLVALIEAAL